MALTIATMFGLVTVALYVADLIERGINDIDRWRDE